MTVMLKKEPSELLSLTNKVFELDMKFGNALTY